MKIPLSVIILTFNEELHLTRCLDNIGDWADEIFVVDGYSEDKTPSIAKKYRINFVQHKFVNQSQQFEWALSHLKIKNEWILRLDADEYLTTELKQEIGDILPRIANEINGFEIKRRVYFMGRWLRHGGYYPVWILRLFRKGKAKMEQREMDEQLILTEGKIGKLKNDFVDDCRKDLSFFIDKHNCYADRETQAIANCQSQLRLQPKLFGSQSEQRRYLKENFYLRLPPFFRAFLFFIYRYFFRWGFLDGKEGLIFIVLQCFWYRFLVDAKLYERQKTTEKTLTKLL